MRGFAHGGLRQRRLPLQPAGLYAHAQEPEAAACSGRRSFVAVVVLGVVLHVGLGGSGLVGCAVRAVWSLDVDVAVVMKVVGRWFLLVSWCSLSVRSPGRSSRLA